jgi:murein L,D-transpeptidase YcbB/YkuD
MKSARMGWTLPAKQGNPGHCRCGMAARASLPVSTVRRVLGVLLFAVIFLPFGTRNHLLVSVGATSSDARPASSDGSFLREIITSGRLTDLRWPDFSDYRNHLQSLYEPTSFSLLWIDQGRPTPQALAIIEVLEEADRNGLDPEDYDGARWKGRLTRESQAGSEARFDVALSVCLMRYISDLHIGKVNPKHFGFGLSVEGKKYDLPQFIRDRLVTGQNIKATLVEVEPRFPGYKRTLAALRHYLDISQQDDGEKLPVPSKTLEPGDRYAGVMRLTRLLRLLGDLPKDTPVPSDVLYDGAVVEGVKRFQQRHGLLPDGRVGEQTLKQLNTPLSFRVRQLQLTLERWRWLPVEYPEPPVVVNIPEFRLRTYDDVGRSALAMNVIVGKAIRHETPVFEKEMRFVVFRPYWNVPASIQRSELVPAIQRDRNYVASQNYEIVTQDGRVVTAGAVSSDVLEKLRAGKLAIRQKPGPNNALGLIKFMFPNEYHVYLHSTPSQQLFTRARRDFSHGCIRVEMPTELAAWVLRDQPEWNLERIRAAMQSGKDNLQLNLTKPIPVLILYGTAVVDEQGTVHFFDDLYGHDAALEKVLAKGYPYPG